MKLKINTYAGRAPKYHEEAIRDGMAVVATNTRDDRGTLESWNGPQAVGALLLPSTVQTLHRYAGGLWLHWNEPVEACRFPLLNDPFEYLGITDADYPKITRNDIATTHGTPRTFRMGLPAPLTPVLTQNVTGGPGTDPGDVTVDEYNTAYRLTYVDDWGREGPSSEHSPVRTIRETDTGERIDSIRIAAPGIPTGNYPMTANSRYRIYRLNNTVWQFVAERGVTASFTDTVPSASLQEEMATADWVAPPGEDASVDPNGPLRSLCVVSEGIMAGHTRHDVCFSVPGTTHAWPLANRLTFPEEVRRVLPHGSEVAVLTGERPYLLVGSDPSSMQRVDTGTHAPLASPLGAVSIDGATYFASYRGLFRIRDYRCENIMAHYMDEQEWAEMMPSTMRLYEYDGRVVISAPDAPDGGASLVLNPAKPDDGVRDLSINLAQAIPVPETGDLAYLGAGSPYRPVLLFNKDASNRLPVLYASKQYTLGRPYAMNCARLRCNEYEPGRSFDVTFVARRLNGTEWRYNKTVYMDDQWFWLPASPQARTWWVEVTGDPKIRSIELATAPEELNA